MNRDFAPTYRLIVACLMLLFLPTVQAQDIIGVITSKHTGDSLVGVKIYWSHHSDDPVFSDKDGLYRIKQKDGDSVLVFEKPGKKTRTFTHSRMEDQYWELNIRMEDLGLTSTTASHWEQSVYEIPASTVIMTREEIERNGYMTLQEILENVPGFFTIDHRSESDVTLGVRGFWAPFNRNVMIQVNGVNMLSERQNDFPLNKINVPVQSVERIEIVRGPMSVIYGAGAFFGVINIITINPLESNADSQFSVGYGSQNAFEQFLRYSVNDNGWLFSLNAMNKQRDGFVQPWDAMVSDSVYTFYANTYNAVAPYDTNTIDQYRGQMVNRERYSRSHQSVNMSLLRKGFNFNMNLALSDFGFSFIEPGPGMRNSYVSNTIRTQIGYDQTQNKHYNYTVSVAHMFSLVDANYRYYQPESYAPGEDRVASVRADYNSRWIVSESADTSWYVHLSNGLSYTNNYRNASIYNAAEINLRNWYIGLKPGTALHTVGAYVQSDIKLNNFRIVAGGRAERQGAYEMLSAANVDYLFPYTYTDDNQQTVYDTVFLEPTIVEDRNTVNDRINFIPRLALLYKFGDNDTSAHHLRLMYSAALKQPSVVDNAADIMLGYDGPDRPYLVPERIRTFELGYTFSFDLENYEDTIRKHFMINTNVFRNSLIDLVTRSTEIEDGTYVTASENGGHLVTHGIELISTAEYQFPRTRAIQKRPFTIGASGYVTYQKTLIIDDDAINNENVSFSPNLLAGSTFSLQLERFRNAKNRVILGSVAFSLGFNYVGAMKSHFVPETTGTVANPIPPHFIGTTADDYFRFSANIRLNDLRLFKEKYGGFYVNLKAANLFNKQYYYPTYTINAWADKGMLGRPRQLLLTVGYKF